MTPNLLRRIVVAAVGIPAAFGLIYLGGWWLTAPVALLAVAGAAEVYRLAAAGGVRAVRGVGLGGAAALPVLAYTASPSGPGVDALWAALAGASWVIATMAIAMRTHSPAERPLAAVSVTLFGALYAGGLPAFLIVLRHGLAPADRLAATCVVFLPLVLMWVCDTAAMGGGTLVGGPRLAPVVSPKKTWAGAITGTASAVVVAPLYGSLVLRRFGMDATWWELALFGLVIAVVGQAGDVAESLLKREVGVKDSGGFFPGHGGVLDRLDSLYWVLPAAVALLALYGMG